MIYVSNEREVLKMKKVKESVQELYQEKVVAEFHMSLKEGSTIEEAFNNASILARGISNGGTYLGYEYDYVKCIEFLSTAMMNIGDE
jgi:hypothetical protein